MPPISNKPDQKLYRESIFFHMKLNSLALRVSWGRMRRYLDRLTFGGSWAEMVSHEIRHNLRWFWLDGLFAAASDNIILTYLSLYVLALGATRTQIGLMSSLGSLSATLVLLPGAWLVERWGHRKGITVFSGGIVSRLMLFFLVLVPWFFQGPAAVVVAITLSVIRDAFSNLSLPAWVSLTADIVPLSRRGSYFSARNIVMVIAGMASMLLVGELITRTGQPAGYQIALGLAFGIGLLSTYSFSRLREPAAAIAAPQEKTMRPRAMLRELRAAPNFLTYMVMAALWNFSLNIAGPFFNLFLVQDLHSTATMVAIVSVASSLSSLPAQRWLGPLVDRIGARRMQMVTGLLIPIVPFLWAFVRAPWQAAPINILSGVLWAGYSLASFNLLLEITPHEQRARYTALYQAVVSIALAVGAALGGVIATLWGYRMVFLLSALGRLIAAILFARLVRAPAAADVADVA